MLPVGWGELPIMVPFEKLRAGSTHHERNLIEVS